MDPVIPPKSNRREKRDWLTGRGAGTSCGVAHDTTCIGNRWWRSTDSCLNRERQQWRGVATRYAKRTASYLAICQLRASDDLEPNSILNDTP